MLLDVKHFLFLSARLEFASVQPQLMLAHCLHGSALTCKRVQLSSMLAREEVAVDKGRLFTVSIDWVLAGFLCDLQTAGTRPVRQALVDHALC